MGPTITHLVGRGSQVYFRFFFGGHSSHMMSHVHFHLGTISTHLPFRAVFPLNHDRRKSTLPETNIESENLMLGRLVSFWGWLPGTVRTVSYYTGCKTLGPPKWTGNY